ncbi:hypothetical protein DMN91_007315 [Ooceraea biroi]|uniref:BZIP domain-containing protein n=1 Tax=Ooceraea biroi TaxID=2015173 RepID=A0A3L8DKK1_OOCBI|nr:hypothetical protein DMN91_007315 [Ooceraea biroi]
MKRSSPRITWTSARKDKNRAGANIKNYFSKNEFAFSHEDDVHWRRNVRPILRVASLAKLQSLWPELSSNKLIFYLHFIMAKPGATSRHFVTTNGITTLHRRPRSEKKPIPDDQKDEKYFERRKRNNQAAKKSRDARKIREDHVALRATMLEHENAILKAQIVTLREEAQSLRYMLIKQDTPAIQSIERSLSSITPVTLSPPHTASSLDC